MSANYLAGLALAGLILGASSALAGDTVRFTQNNPINVKVILDLNRGDTNRNYDVSQNGTYNSVAIVSKSNGGNTDIRQKGHQNRALVGSYGSDQSTLIEQMSSARGSFGRLSRR